MKLLGRIITIITSVAIICCCLSSCGTLNSASSSYTASESKDDSNWNIATENNVVLQNSTVSLVLNTSTTHFTLTDLRTGKAYSSVPADSKLSYSSEEDFRMNSELSLCYYGTQTSGTNMFSAKDSVDAKQFSIKYTDDAIRVYYRFGASSDSKFAPTVLSRDYYETMLSKLNDRTITRRMGRYYTLYSSSDQNEDYKKMLALYPALAKTDMYIINSTVSDTEKDEIGGYIASYGLTKSDYQDMLKNLNVEVTEEDLPAGFCVPVEYKLTDDGFQASILADKITENSKDYILQNIDLLEYFSCSNKDESGYYFIPDGSGSLMKLNNGNSGNISQPFYSGDYSVQTGSLSQISKSLNLPVFGISLKDGGLFAIVEQAAEVATLKASPLSSSSPKNHIHVNFTMRSMDATDLGATMQIPVYNLFSGHRLKTSPTIRFVLLKNGSQDYASMASYYRNYLLKNGKLSENANTADDPKLYLDYLCMTTEDANIMGISYTKKIVLSKLSDIIKSVTQLKDAGISNVVVRLNGYSSTGLEHSVYNSFDLDKTVGTINELNQLAALIKDMGGTLYLDGEFQFAYNTQNGFAQKTDASHYLNRVLVRYGHYDLVTRKYNKKVLPRFFVTSANYSEYVSSFISDLSKSKISDTIGISYGTAGMYLGGDYTSKRDLDCCMSLSNLQDALKIADSSNKKLAFDNGNYYVLSYADDLFNVPMQSSLLDTEDENVPFYQMVIHGAISYAGSPSNISSDSNTAYLKSIEYGASLYDTFITASDDSITNTDYETMFYSLSDQNRLSVLISKYNATKKLYESVKGATIVGNEQINKDVYQTTYSNGTKVLVNYNDEPVTINGTTIAAKDFAAIGA